MLSELAQFEEIFGPLRVFQYLTFRSALAAALSLLIGFALGPWVIRWLSALKAAQSFRTAEEVGRLAELHAAKKGTPTMGGLIIYLAVVPTVLLCAKLNILILTALFVYTALTIIGFLDDFKKVRDRKSGGLRSREKLVAQAVIAMVALGLLHFDPKMVLLISELWVPFLKTPLISLLPIPLLCIFFFIVLAGSSNAINLTDGMDGLAIGCTVTVALVYGIMAYAAGNVIISDYLFIRYVPGAGELAVFTSAVVGGSLAFLWYNAHPAEIFMGDTGSLALGGLVGIIALMILQPVTLVIVGGMFVVEALSVIIQVISFKTTGRRVFRMSPLHHHFELAGWPETKVVIRFWILSLLCALAGLATLKLR